MVFLAWTESLIEKSLPRKHAGNSWFVEIRRLCVKYSLADLYSVLDSPSSKCQWKRIVQKSVYTYWADILKQRASLYSSLEFLSVDGYWPGKNHPLIQNVCCMSDVPRIHTKLKLVTGGWGGGVCILQVNRACFNQNGNDATCQLCHQADETLADFLLDCPVLESIRRAALEAILSVTSDPLECPGERNQLLHHTSCRGLDMHTRRLCHILNTENYKKFSLIPKRIRKKRSW